MKKFTLIELLIVVAIIGILVTILMPSLNKARAAAKQVVCLSNTRQLGIATQIYLKDNNFKMPRGAEGWDFGQSFGGLASQGIVFLRMAPYLGYEAFYPQTYHWSKRKEYLLDKNIFRCPAKEYNESALLDYSVNSLHFKNYYSTGRYAEAGYLRGGKDELMWPTQYISNLSDTILFADNYRILVNFYPQRTQFFSPSHLPFRNGAPNVNKDNNRMMPYMDKTHLGKISVTTFDGSGKILSLKSAGQWPENDRLTGDWDD